MADTIFYSPNIKQTLQLPEQESQHCVKSLRMKEGDHLTVTDGKGYLYTCELTQAHPKHCLLRIIDEIENPNPRDFHLHIAFAPTKQMERNEWFAEKAVEIGIDRLTPLRCAFSERKEVKTERLEKIMISAMKQSQQASLAQLDEITPFETFIAQPFDGQRFIAHCYPWPKTSFIKLCEKEKDTLVLIGPEGDFSEEEVKKAIERGFQPISLGKTRLRTETACLVAVHTVNIINEK